MTPPDPVAHWGARLLEIATATKVPGAAFGLWVDGHETRVAQGVLSTATQVAVTPHSLFQVGSITKVWTATMIMQLVDEGRLSLEATVAEVLPGVRLGSPDASGEVRVRHLLTHSSGIDGDIWTDTGRGDRCVERYVDALADAHRNYPVGEAYSYCNSGFVVLGRMIEVLDGRTWDASLRARLVEPLGLTETVTLPEEAIFHRAAVGHREHPNEGDPVSVWGLPRSVGPAGLITASVHDVLTFARLHLDGGLSLSGSGSGSGSGTRLLSADSVAAMQQPQVEIPSIGGGGDAIGLAWRLNRWGGQRVIGHDGGTIGQLAYLRVHPEARVAACLLTNSSVSDPLFERLFAEVFEAYAGVTPPAEPVPSGGDAELDLARHVGGYERASRRYDVTLQDGLLRILSTMTGDRAAIGNEGPQQLEVRAVDSSGDRFVCRAYADEPWTGLMFDRFGDGTPYLYLGGRATPRVG